MAVKSIAHYCELYGVWLAKNHPGPRWLMLDAIRRNLELWRCEYGEAVYTQVRTALLAHVQEKKS